MGWGLGWGLPWWGGWGWDSGWGYPYAYSLYDYYPSSEYGYNYPTTTSEYAYSEPAVPDTGTVNVPTPTTIPQDQQQAASEAEQYYTDARSYFEQGDYANALRMGCMRKLMRRPMPRSTSCCRWPSSPVASTPAASEAHAAMAMGPIADWSDLYGYYNDVNKYTTQLRSLEKASTDNPNSAAEHFLLGYQYLMTAP